MWAAMLRQERELLQQQWGRRENSWRLALVRAQPQQQVAEDGDVGGPPEEATGVAGVLSEVG